jgi:hypothetical protein
MATLKGLTVDDTGFIQIPAGTTSERPTSPVNGMMRVNTSLGAPEVYNNGEWIKIDSGLPARKKSLYQLYLSGTPQEIIVGGSTISLRPWTSLIESNISGVFSQYTWTDSSVTYTGVKIEKSGHYRIHAHIGFYNNAASNTEYRQNPIVEINKYPSFGGSVNTTSTDKVVFPCSGRMTYLRNTGGQIVSSAIAEFVDYFDANDIVTISARTTINQDSGKTGSLTDWRGVADNLNSLFYLESV